MIEQMKAWLRDASLALKCLLAVIPGALLLAAGLYAPGSPLRTRRAEVAMADSRLKPLQTEVNNLRGFESQRIELQMNIRALREQLNALQTIVPVDKQTDEFIRLVQDAANSSGIILRRITVRPEISKEYYLEIPFEMEADGPYYAMRDFFGKLSRLSRITNVGDVSLTAAGESRHPKTAPDTTVVGVFTLTTYCTNAAGQSAPGGAAPPAKGK